MGKMQADRPVVKMDGGMPSLLLCGIHGKNKP
jgi:hypothetical protein